MKEPGTDLRGEQGGPPAGVVAKPPLTRELMEADTEFDPEGAERLVEIVRRLRRRGRIAPVHPAE